MGKGAPAAWSSCCGAGPPLRRDVNGARGPTIVDNDRGHNERTHRGHRKYNRTDRGAGAGTYRFERSMCSPDLSDDDDESESLGDSALCISRPVTIEAEVAGSVVLDAGASSRGTSNRRRVFYIESDGVVLAGLNITGGNPYYDTYGDRTRKGGGIYIAPSGRTDISPSGGQVEYETSSASTQSSASLAVYSLLAFAALATSRNPPALAASLAPAALAISSHASAAGAVHVGVALRSCDVSTNRAGEVAVCLPSAIALPDGTSRAPLFG